MPIVPSDYRFDTGPLGRQAILVLNPPALTRRLRATLARSLRGRSPEDLSRVSRVLQLPAMLMIENCEYTAISTPVEMRREYEPVNRLDCMIDVMG